MNYWLCQEKYLAKIAPENAPHARMRALLNRGMMSVLHLYTFILYFSSSLITKFCFDILQVLLCVWCRREDRQGVRCP